MPNNYTSRQLVRNSAHHYLSQNRWIPDWVFEGMIFVGEYVKNDLYPGECGLCVSVHQATVNVLVGPSLKEWPKYGLYIVDKDKT